MDRTERTDPVDQFPKLAEIESQHARLTEQLADPAVLGDQRAYRDLSKQLAELAPAAELSRQHRETRRELAGADELLATLDKGDELHALAADERARLTARLTDLAEKLRHELAARDPHRQRNVLLEIRGGTGGSEATLFAAELLRMYSRYAEVQGWRVELIDLSESEVGGIKEVSAIVEGRGAYSRLKFEGGVHRVQRVPQTEGSGRIHTSAVTVAVLPEAEDIEVELDEQIGRAHV